MNAVSPICLTDLVPALRWSNTHSAGVSAYLRHPRLVDGWWQSLPVARVLDIAGPTWLSQSLARLAADEWGHLSLRELFPTLSAVPVDIEEIAEPVRSTILSTLGTWERLLDTPMGALERWNFPENCNSTAVASTAVWYALQPCTRPAATSGPAPSPALMVEAVRTIAHWLPASAPERVHSALAYLAETTGSDALDDPEPAPAETRQNPASRAIRTLRALRAQRDEEERHTAPGGAPAESPEPAPSPAAPAPEGDRSLRRPAFSGPKARSTEPIAQRPAGPDSGSAPGGRRVAPPSTLGEYPLVELLDQLFHGWPEIERQVAAERLFAVESVNIRVLADRSGIDAGTLRGAQRAVEDRLLRWLSSPAGAPMTNHMRAITEQLGTATTIDQLIAAHPEHPVEVPVLGTPLWRIVIALFTDRRMHEGWLVAGDPHQLRWETRQLVSGRPSITEAGIRLAKLGIRTPAVRAWLLSTPGVTIRDGYVLPDEESAEDDSGLPAGLPRRLPTSASPAAGATTSNGLPIRRRTGAPSTPPAPEPDPSVAMSARCFRAPDGRWWHRVDVTADQLNGAPVAVPPGYATHLGLQPGRLLCLTAPGADLLVLVWRDKPAFDSLRPLLRRLSAQPGDRVFITVQGDQLDARRLPSRDLSEHGPTSKALHLIGYTAPASTEEALEIIARRISEDGESGPPDHNQLMETLEKRGDADIAKELRPALYAVN